MFVSPTEDPNSKTNPRINSVAYCGIFVGQNGTGMGTALCITARHTMVATFDHSQRTWHVYSLLRLCKYALVLSWFILF